MPPRSARARRVASPLWGDGRAAARATGLRACPRASQPPRSARRSRSTAGTRPSTTRAARRGRWISITEAVLLSLVAVFAAYSGYCAAKWGTESSVVAGEGLRGPDEGQPRRPRGAADPHARLRLVQRRRSRPLTVARPGGPAAGRPAPAPGVPAGVPGLAGPAPADEPARGARPVLPAAVPHRAGRRSRAASTARRTPPSSRGARPGRPPTTTCASRSCWRRSCSSSASAATSRVHVARYGLIGMALVLLAGAFVELASLPGPPG